MTLRISNRTARHLIIEANGLSRPPIGGLDLTAHIKSLRYVQLDTIRTVSRAHHHILWSRNQAYREPDLWRLLKNRDVFEHFTHDASILPMELYPVWQLQCRRFEAKLRSSKYGSIDKGLITYVKDRIRQQGPLSTRDFDTKISGPKKMWSRPPHKRALDFLWYAGELATSHRENFTKFYDLSERVIPEKFREQNLQEHQQLDWLCRDALQYLMIATPSDVQDFWGVASSKEVKIWLLSDKSVVVPVQIETAQGEWLPGFARSDIDEILQGLSTPTSRLRILNPFDPLTRNRKRLSRIFGFDYKIEMFVPAAKRKWGYYVYPVLEGDKFVARTEIKANRKAGTLSVLAVWPEPDVRWTASRARKFDAELKRLATFIGVKTVNNP